MVIGGVFTWYWGLLLVVFGLFCVWIGATVSTLIKQRNKAHGILSAKPKPTPLPNRNELLRAISEVRDASGKLLWAQQELDDLQAASSGVIHTEAIESRNNAHVKYDQAMSKLEAEKLVAGQAFEKILSDLEGYVSTQIWVKEAKPVFVGGDPHRTALDIFGGIAGKIAMTVGEIDEVTLR